MVMSGALWLYIDGCLPKMSEWSAKETYISPFEFGKSCGDIHHVLVEGAVTGFCFGLVLAQRGRVTIIYTQEFLCLSEFVICRFLGCGLILLAIHLAHLPWFLERLVVWLLQGAIQWSPWLESLSLWLNIGLDASLDVVQHVGGELKQLLSFILLRIDLDCRWVVGEAGHFEGTQRRGGIPTTTETFFVQFNDTTPLTQSCWIFPTVLLHPHKGNVLLIYLVLNLKVIHKRAEVIE